MIDYATDIIRMVSAFDMADMYGYKPDRRGNILCPFHDDRKPSLKLYNGDRGFYCFSCGAGGNVINFVMRLFGLSFFDACCKINDDFHLGLAIGSKPSLRQARRCKAIKSAIDAKKAEHDRLKSDYDIAMDKWCEYDMALMHEAPESEKWADAAKNIATAKYNLEEAEMRLRDYESK